MESFAAALNIAIPVFLFLIGIEWFVSRYKGVEVYDSMDTISSLSSGMSNITKSVLGLTVSIISYEWLETNYGIWQMNLQWWHFLVVFMAKDFAGYWVHRLEHVVNIFWNRHIIHHSSEEFNLACALRQSVSEVIGLIGLLVLPLALIGIPFEAYAIVAPIHLFLQFWYHTRLIDKMGPLEAFLVTPSHHRVHHAINPEYIDKNYAQIFIVWDKLFGTFQPELEELKPVYGVKRQVKTWNPVFINFQHLALLIRDAWRTKNWKDKFKIWFMPTGWRPEDVKERFPLEVVQVPEKMVKYRTDHPTWAKLYFSFRLLFNLSIMLILFNSLADLAPILVLLIGAYLILDILAFTSAMDKFKPALIFDWVKSFFALYLLIFFGLWDVLNVYEPVLAWAIAFLLAVTPWITAISIRNTDREPRKNFVFSRNDS